MFRSRYIIFGVLIMAFCPGLAYAASGNTELNAALLALFTALFVARLGGDLALRFKQPEVVGELTVGIILGNLYLLGFEKFEFLKDSEALRLFSELGVIFLLFEVGMETKLEDLLKLGWVSTKVALLGILLPISAGYGVSWLFYPEAPIFQHLFLGATLSATSIGITARVFKDLGVLERKFAKIVLGAAVLDDIAGLILLATLSGLIAATNSGSAMHYSDIGLLTLKSVGFLVLSVLVGRLALPSVVKTLALFKSGSALSCFLFVFCFLMSYLASLVGLASVVGAFTAGLIVGDIAHGRVALPESLRASEISLGPVLDLFLPVFFLLIGFGVDLGVFSTGSNVLFIVVLSIAAGLSKIAAGLGVKERRLEVGLSMMPRGEVGLIFAAVGSALVLRGQPLFSGDEFSALVMVVLITTIACPPLLSWVLRKNP